jgi:flagellar hook assembly protein FlgD
VSVACAQLIYDVNGRQVRTLVNGTMDAGTHQVVWDGTNDDGHKVGSGVYWSQMKAGSYVSSKKMVILK